MEHELPAPEPEHCPGPESETAGKGAACAGCPNQAVCSALPRGPDPDLPLIRARMKDVKHKLLVLSGKGGVGKSTFASMMGWALAADESREVGICDIDITGPSIPTIFASTTAQIHTSASGWSPVYVSENLSLMSIGFLLPSHDTPIIWRGSKKNGLIKQFLRDVEWGEMDYLVIDTPPGTSDEHLSVAQYLEASTYSKSYAGLGAIVVTTPQEVALLDVRKELDFCKKAGIPVLGVVENMAGFVCPACTHESQIFAPTTGGGKALAEEFGVPFLGSIPLDPRIGKACDYGEDFLDLYPESPASKRILEIMQRIRDTVGDTPDTEGANRAGGATED